MKEKRQLTKSELQVMLILWSLPGKGGFIKDIRARFEGRQPAYTTLATFLKILADKGFVKPIKEGTMLYYLPLISKEDYCTQVMEKAQADFFDNDPAAFVQFIIRQNTLTDEQKQRIAESLS